MAGLLVLAAAPALPAQGLERNHSPLQYRRRNASALICNALNEVATILSYRAAKRLTACEIGAIMEAVSLLADAKLVGQ